MNLTKQLEEALEVANLQIIKFDPSKQRPVSTSDGTMNLEKFCKMFRERLGKKGMSFPGAFGALHDISEARDMLEEYARDNKILIKDKKDIEIEMPKGIEDLTLNLNLAAKGRDEKFFLTHPDETVAKMSGEVYLMLNQITPLEAAAAARKVHPEYHPRGPKGVFESKSLGKTEEVFNIYTPPAWEDYHDWKKLPDRLPLLFEKLINHLFPIREEREYALAWLHDSLFSRAFVYKILCGAPGTGKNRYKLVVRALHGHVNVSDGKKSTLVERFNSQLSESTLAWFDELHYDADMENVMKELQNDSISIERKGVDATRGTKIYASLVISNNKPRDNHIAFDARKFVPLVITDRRLEESMTPAEIDELTRKVEDQSSEDFDIRFIAQIAKWIKKHGASKKWPNLEYRGPMFWTLAHTSMTRWQKKCAMMILSPDGGRRVGWDDDIEAYLWSEINEKATRKNGDRSLMFPDFSSVKAFFEVFRDSKGRKAFSTESVKGNIMGDFWIKPLFKQTEIITEATIAQQRELRDRNERTKKDSDDL